MVFPTKTGNGAPSIDFLIKTSIIAVSSAINSGKSPESGLMITTEYVQPISKKITPLIEECRGCSAALCQERGLRIHPNGIYTQHRHTIFTANGTIHKLSYTGCYLRYFLFSRLPTGSIGNQMNLLSGRQLLSPRKGFYVKFSIFEVCCS